MLHWTGYRGDPPAILSRADHWEPGIYPIDLLAHTGPGSHVNYYDENGLTYTDLTTFTPHPLYPWYYQVEGFKDPWYYHPSTRTGRMYYYLLTVGEQEVLKLRAEERNAVRSRVTTYQYLLTNPVVADVARSASNDDDDDIDVNI